MVIVIGPPILIPVILDFRDFSHTFYLKPWASSAERFRANGNFRPISSFPKQRT